MRHLQLTFYAHHTRPTYDLVAMRNYAMLSRANLMTPHALLHPGVLGILTNAELHLLLDAVTAELRKRLPQ